MSSRRDFLAVSAAAGVGLGLGGRPEDGHGDISGIASVQGRDASISGVEPAPRSLRLLFLGGTGFLGPAEVEYAMARGHTVTLFNRGRTNTHLFPDVEKLVGDRATPDLSALEGREWDVVLDTSANAAVWVKDTAELLKDSVGRYLFVSSLSAHSDTSTLWQTEEAPVFSRADYDEAIASGASIGAAFGPNKAEAERLVTERFGERGLVVRPTLIVGPGDRSDRFTYWPVRIDQGGEVLAPGDGSDLVQWVDVRDLGRFIIDLVEAEASGTYNAAGPSSPYTIAETLHGIRAATAADVNFTWVSADVLREHEVGAWMEMPLWVYPSADTRGFSAFANNKAVAAGLTYRPLADTARDTLVWWKDGPGRERELRTGVEPEKEQAVLAAWHAREG